MDVLDDDRRAAETAGRTRSDTTAGDGVIICQGEGATRGCMWKGVPFSKVVAAGGIAKGLDLELVFGHLIDVLCRVWYIMCKCNGQGPFINRCSQNFHSCSIFEYFEISEANIHTQPIFFPNACLCLFSGFQNNVFPQFFL